MRVLLFSLLLWTAAACWGAEEQPPVTELTAKYFLEPGAADLAGKAQTAIQEAFYLQHPDIRLKAWSGLRLPGNMWQQSDLLAFAGGVAADIQPLFFHQVQFYAAQGVLAPLGHLVLDESGPQHEYWKRLPEAFRQAGILNGEVYAIPSGCFSPAFLYRREVFESVGLNPDQTPATLDELWVACQKLTNPNLEGPGGVRIDRYAFSSADLMANFMSYFFASGASLVETEWLDSQERVVLTSKLGEKTPELALRDRLKPRFRAAFDSPEGREAMRWIHKFRWAPWVRDAKTGAIRDLTEGEAATTTGVIRGVVRPVLTQGDKDGLALLRRGRLAFATIYLRARTGDLEQTSLGILPFPPVRAGDPSPTPLLAVMVGLNRDLVGTPQKLAAAESWLCFYTGEQASKIENDVYVDNGMARIISVWEMRRAGMENLATNLPRQWLAAQNYLFAGQNVVPFINGWTAINQELESSVIEPTLNSPTFDYTAALAQVARTANDKVLGHTPKKTRDSRMKWAALCVAITVIALGIGGILVIRSQLSQARAAAPIQSLKPGTKQSRILLYTALMLLPALLLLAVFSYYPVARGLVMAFQEYRLSGDSVFVGLNNFSEGLFASRFWIASANTLIFVALNLGLGFLVPLLLAVLISELPVGTSVFRTIYYLPAVIAGLVVTLLWMRLYEPTEFGLLNQFLHPLFTAWNSLAPADAQADWPVKWLQNPKWAMLAVIVPTIWASAGPGSLIYLAALKSIPDEMYEAADLDGCSSWKKFTSITIPAIFPLLLINFIGAFIGTFQSMGNIFVMTGGGPNYATHILALEIWQNAFLYLRFGVATAQAWILAAALIGAVVLQLRLLERMDWRRAGT